MAGVQRDYLAEEEGGGGAGAGPGVSPTDKLLFTVQIYDSFYVPNRKAQRFIGGNGTVGNTPGDWQIQLPPPPHSAPHPSPHSTHPWLGFRFTLPGPKHHHHHHEQQQQTPSGKRGEPR